MLQDIGRIISISNSKAMVEVERSSACASCGLQEVEELSGGRAVFEAINMVNASVGDKVKIEVRSSSQTKLSAFVYGIPMLFLLLGAIFGGYMANRLNRPVDTMSSIFSMMGLIIGVLFVIGLRKRLAKKEYTPVIVEVINQSLD
ncbi:MAG: hypothetical protein D6828_04360 [Nitrospirae bacterium]|nr:MAG: hypothetical protein D6828_04360 [Nitrospirota bacterium]